MSTVLNEVSDVLCAAMPLRNRDRAGIRAALKLMAASNPELVMFVLYELAAIHEEQPAEVPHEG